MFSSAMLFYRVAKNLDPTEKPSLSPLVGTCEDNGLITHLKWGNISESLPNYQFDLAIDTNNYGINIDIVTEYLGYSYDYDMNQLPTTYIFDFEHDEKSV